MYIQYGIHTDRGRIRISNEDSYVANAKSRLFLVADGMGGHAAGEIASAIAASTVEECVALRRGSGRSPQEILRLAVQEANSRIYETQLERADLSGMGSTLTALGFAEDSYFLAHVGDSRAYLMRGGMLQQITRDHSLVWHLYENGVIAKKDLACHPQKNLITRSIGPHPHVEIDMGSGEAREGDCYLLCSDGLTDVVQDEMIAAMLADTSRAPQEASEALVEAANRAGGPDNVTVIVVRIATGDLADDETGRVFLK